MIQLAKEKQVNLGTSARLNALSQYVLRVSFSSSGCSTAKSKTPPQETFFYPLSGTEHGSQPSLTTRDRELVSVLKFGIKPGNLNPIPLIPQSVTLPTLPRAGRVDIYIYIYIYIVSGAVVRS